MSIEHDFDLDPPAPVEPVAAEALPAPIIVIQYRYPKISRFLLPVLLVAGGMGLLTVRDRLRTRLAPVLAAFSPAPAASSGRKIDVSPSEVKAADPVVLWKDREEIEADKESESSTREQANGSVSAETSRSVVDSIVAGDDLIEMIAKGVPKPIDKAADVDLAAQVLNKPSDGSKSNDNALKHDEAAAGEAIGANPQPSELVAAGSVQGEARRIFVPSPAGSAEGVLVILSDRGPELVRRDAFSTAGSRPKALERNEEAGGGRSPSLLTADKPAKRAAADPNSAAVVARPKPFSKPVERRVAPEAVKPEPGSNGLMASAEDQPREATGDKSAILDEIRRDSARKEAERVKLLDRKQNGPTHQERLADRRARMERLEQAAIEADKERVHFLDELKSVIDRFGVRSAPAIRKLEDKYGRHTQPEMSNEAKEVIGPNVPISSASHTIHRLRVIGLPETLILDHLNDRQMTLINARNGPMNADDALVRAAKILLRNPIVRSSSRPAASDARRTPSTARNAG